jgi:threonine/homoserine/homoserine lactone efflux protein
MLWSFLPVAALLTLTPGPATVLVIRSAARGGRGEALATTLGNEVGVLMWGIAAAVGLAAVVAASATAFTVVKLVGAAGLVLLGAYWLLRAGSTQHADAEMATTPRRHGWRPAFAAGLLSAMTNPKLAAFYVALFPQFLPNHGSVFGAAIAMGTLIGRLDLVWYSTLALLVARVARALLDGGWLRRIQRACGAVLVGLGIRLALEERAV